MLGNGPALAVTLATAALTGAPLVSPGSAAAAACANNLVDAGMFEWDLDAGGEIVNGRHLPSGRSDAFDRFGNLFLSNNGGATFREYANPDANGCVLEDGGREIAFPADATTIPGLELRRKVFVPATGLPFARWIDFLTNTTGAPITVIAR